MNKTYLYKIPPIALLTLLVAACNDDFGGLGHSSHDAISFGVDMSDPWDVQLTRSGKPDTLYYSIDEIPNSPYLVETVTLRGMPASKSDAPRTRGVQIGPSNFDREVSSFSVFSPCYCDGGPYAYIENEEVYLEEHPDATDVDKIWHGESTHYWLDQNSNLRFYGITPTPTLLNNDMDIPGGDDYPDMQRPAPHISTRGLSQGNQDVIGGGIPIITNPLTVSKDISPISWYISYHVPENSLEHIDLMFAKGVDENGDDLIAGNYNKAVKMHFRHLLAAVQVRVSPAAKNHTNNSVAHEEIIDGIDLFGICPDLYLDLDDIAIQEYFEDPYGYPNEDSRVTCRFDQGIEVQDDVFPVVSSRATFLVPPQAHCGESGVEVYGHEKGTAPNDSVPLRYVLNQTTWEPGTTTIYTIFPREVTLSMPRFDNWSETKNTFSPTKTFTVPIDAKVEIPDPDVSKYNAYESMQRWDLLGWVPYPYMVTAHNSLDSISTKVKKLEGFVENGGTCKISQNTTLYPIVQFSGNCGAALICKGSNGKGTYEWEDYSSHGFINGYVMDFDLNDLAPLIPNRSYMNKYTFGGKVYDIPENRIILYTVTRKFEYGEIVIDEKPFWVEYDTSALGEDMVMPEEEKTNFGRTIVTGRKHIIELSSWQKGKIMWDYYDRNGIKHSIAPGGNLEVDYFDTMRVTLTARKI